VNELTEAKAQAGTDEFRLENFLPYRLAVAADNVSRIITRQHLSASGLGMSEWRLLAAVGRYGVLSPTAAGSRTSMDKVKVSRAAASLVARGMMRQSQDPEDGRGRLLRLTRKGVGLYGKLGAMAQAIEIELAEGLTKAEWSALHRSLGKLMDHTRTMLGDSDNAADAVG
jgi:DNA-binding MarR family transcriptional regulator